MRSIGNLTFAVVRAGQNRPNERRRSGRRRLGRDDRDLDELTTARDRKELRQRYYGLLQELRVVLPGVQVLVAFLLTVPFAQRFPELDDWGRRAYGVSLIASMLSVICLLTPTVYHRVARRTERTARLRWGIRMTIAGQWLIAVALVSGLWCVSRLVFGFRAPG